MKSATHYGNGKEVNEFGHPKVEKDINFVHDISHRAGRRDIPSTSWAMDKAAEFYEQNGRYPTKLLLTGPRRGTTFKGFVMDLHDFPRAFIGLDVVYGAKEDCVA